MDISQIQAIFIDRDGTIGGTDDVILPRDFELYPLVQDSINKLKESGKHIFSFTNQPGIARGEVTLIEFEEELRSFGFDGMYICPHEHGDGCQCRKPSSGMLRKAADENNLDLKRCVVIGDRWTDMVAATEAGCMKVLVQTGSGERDLSKYINNEYFGLWTESYPDYVARDFNAAVKWILK